MSNEFFQVGVVNSYVRVSPKLTQAEYQAQILFQPKLTCHGQTGEMRIY